MIISAGTRAVDDVVMTGWTGRPATEIAAAVRAGEATAAQVVAGHLDRIARLNAELGAFVRVRAAEAAAEADAVDKRADRAELPLAGVPVAVKDAVPVTGEPMRVGSAARPDQVQGEDHPVVARLRAAGAVVVGLTNLPELAIYPFTDSVFGITRNPWDRRRTAGGSSGGSAAAVAGALVPVAHGTDGLGSVRIPAAACGLFGIKPGAGVIPAKLGGDDWFGLSENGVLASTIADAAVTLGVLAGTAFPVAEQPRLRIAVSVRPPGPGIIVHRTCATAVRQCARLLATLDHDVQQADPPYPGWLVPVLLSYWFAGPAADAGGQVAGLEPRTRRHVRAGQAVLRVRPPAEADRQRLRAALEPFFERHDVLVMPTLARPCPPARRYGERSWLRSVATALTFAPMTGVWNLAGFPAASVPAGGAELPAAVQLVAAPGREQVLLALAAQLERAQGWPRHAPAYRGSLLPGRLAAATRLVSAAALSEPQLEALVGGLEARRSRRTRP
jgi:amidase